MPSWAGLSTSASHSTSTTTSNNHHHDLDNSSIDQIAATTPRDSGFNDSAHVRSVSNSNSNGKVNSKGNNMNGHENNSNTMTMPWSSSSFSFKGKQPYSVTAASAEGYQQNHDNGENTSDIPHSHSTGEFNNQEEEEGEGEGESDSLAQLLDTEEVEALLWDAQMALIAHQYQTGVSVLEKAAKGGSSTACLSLANIYHKGLPCSTHPHSHSHHKKHTISPSKLIEGSISTDQVKTASYLLQALELEAAKAEYNDLDLEVLSDASLLLCNMFRYGKIRPRDPSRTSGPMRELSISSELKKSNSFLNPIIDESITEPNESAWIKGGRLAKALTEKIKTALEKKGVSWSADSDIMEDHDASTSTTSQLQDADVERLDTILVCLYYIIALVSGSREGPEAVKESIRYWKLLLASHAVFSSLHMSKSKTKSGKNGHAPIRQSSRSSPKLDDLITKAEKRLHLLTTALEESQKQPNGSSIRPRDIILRRDTSEYSASLLFSPTSDSSMHFGSSHTDSPKRDSSDSRMEASQQSVDTACSCELPIPPSPRRRNGNGLSAPDKTPQKKRTAKFAIHDSPASVMSAAPPSLRPMQSGAPTSRQKTVPPALFRGFQKQSSLNLRQSLTAQSTSSSHLSLADLASSASSIAPSTYRRPGDLRRPLLDRKASQVSLASTTAFGRRAWAGPSAQPMSRVSNLSSASLHTLAPTTDRHMSESGVLSLPHNSTTKSQSVNATQVLSSLRASTSASQPGPSSHTGSRFKNVVSSLGSFFTTASTGNGSTTDASKAKKELEKVAEQHDAEVENFYSWEEDRTSSEEESLHSGSPSNHGGDGDSESVIEGVDAPPHLGPEEEARQAEEVAPAPLSASRGRQARNMDGNTQRPVYSLSTSISSSYLHASTPTASPRRGGMPTFPAATAPTKSPTKDTRSHREEAVGSSTSKLSADRPPPPSRLTKSNSPYKPTKIDPLLAALEAASRVNVKSRCSVCGIQGVNFPACQKCGITFCSRDCRVASGGDAGRHVCQLDSN